MKRLSAPAGGLFLAMLALPLLGLGQTHSVEESVHNLSVTGPGTVKSSSDVGVCIFCHAPHNTQGVSPLWNKEERPDIYQNYSSSTYKQLNNNITTRSKLCLSCHDGTIALGQTIATGDLGVTSPLPASSDLGTDLRMDHPFGFTLPAQDDGEIKSWLMTAPVTSPDPTVRLYGDRLECVTCHDPHVPDKDPLLQKFLVRDASNGGLCTVCHDPARGAMAGWSISAHATSTNAIASPTTAYRTVAENACLSCHTSHNAAGTGARLLRASEETTCVTCHSSATGVTPPAPNVIDQITKSRYSHPILTVTDVHDPTETLPVSNARHSECADCHNPHVARTETIPATRPASPASLLGVSGVSATNGTTVVQPANNEYEVCFKCHADSTNKPQNATYTQYGRTPYRQTFVAVADPFNVRLDFQSAVARHNVTQPAGNRGVVSPSLRANMLDLAGNPTGPSLQAGTFLYCTDCHNSDEARSAGGSAPNGPHGSNNEHLLERRYDINLLPPGGAGSDFSEITYIPGSAGPYAMCDKCHDIDNRILQNDTVFGKHERHVVDVGASCSTCHAPHGIQGGTAQANSHLINFDTSIVGPDSQARLMINTTTRTCYLRCHGENHSGTSY
jgi:predicted CXXCH cytochrome family protein